MQKNPDNPQKYRRKAPKYITERIKIEKLIPGGQALATLESGKKAFLWNALPGETVAQARIYKEKSHFVEAIAEEFESTSLHRIDPLDECYLATSPWQIMDYDYELTEKLNLLREIFLQHKIDTPVEISSVQTDGRDFAYRNKMEYALYYSHDDGKIYPAFHMRGSHQKIPISTSHLERPEIWQKACEIFDNLNNTHADAREYQSLLLRTSQNGQVEGGLFKNHEPHPQFANLSDEILGHRYTYSPNGFFQINLPVYEMALTEIQKWIKTKKVLDLYSGVGTIGLSCARNCDLTLVEIDKSAYAELEKNAASTSARTICAKSEEVLDYIAPDQTVIVDPPRAGCDVKLIDKFLDVQPECIIYLSCNPATQARDVKALLEIYDIRRIVPYNFFPRTPHLENLIILERKPSHAAN